jgi:hypothetical protein
MRKRRDLGGLKTLCAGLGKTRFASSQMHTFVFENAAGAKRGPVYQKEGVFELKNYSCFGLSSVTKQRVARFELTFKGGNWTSCLKHSNDRKDEFHAQTLARFRRT